MTMIIVCMNSTSCRVHNGDVVADNAMMLDLILFLSDDPPWRNFKTERFCLVRHICSSRSHFALPQHRMTSMLALYTGSNMCNVQPLEGSHHLQCTMGTHATRVRQWGLCWACQGCTLRAVASGTLLQLCLHVPCWYSVVCAVSVSVSVFVSNPNASQYCLYTQGWMHSHCGQGLLKKVAHETDPNTAFTPIAHASSCFLFPQWCGPAYCMLTNFWKHFCVYFLHNFANEFIIHSYSKF